MEKNPDYYHDMLAASALEPGDSESPDPAALDQEAHQLDHTIQDSERDAAAGTGAPSLLKAGKAPDPMPDEGSQLPCSHSLIRAHP